MRLQNKVAVISGAGSGIGRATALRFAAEGSRVMVADISSSNGQETTKLIKASGGEASFIQTDVSIVANLERMVRATIETYERLDVLFNHAGMAGPGGNEEFDEKQWHKVIDVNLSSGLFAVKYAVPEMKRSGGGSIIFTSSVSGLVGSPNSPTYSAVKGGIVTLVKSLALRFAADSIRVNCICPGPTETPMLPYFFGKSTDLQTVLPNVIRNIPLGRLGKPEDVANAALFLASDESSYITGIALPVDGGYIAR